MTLIGENIGEPSLGPPPEPQPQGSRRFPARVLLSITSGFNFADDFSDVHSAIEFLADMPVWTHQLPRVVEELNPRLLAANPILDVNVSDTTKDNWCEVLARTGLDRVWIEVAPLGQIEKRNPLEELRELVPDVRPIVIEHGGGARMSLVGESIGEPSLDPPPEPREREEHVPVRDASYELLKRHILDDCDVLGSDPPDEEMCQVMWCLREIFRVCGVRKIKLTGKDIEDEHERRLSVYE